MCQYSFILCHYVILPSISLRVPCRNVLWFSSECKYHVFKTPTKKVICILKLDTPYQKRRQIKTPRRNEHCTKNLEFLVEDLQFIPWSCTHNLVIEIWKKNRIRWRACLLCMFCFYNTSATFIYICNTHALFPSVLRRALSTGRWPSKVLLILLSSGAILLRKFLVDFSPPCIQPTGTSYKIELQGKIRK
jgi:hypothetical protein